MKLRIKELREKNNKLQRDIAKYLGVERKTYSKWETFARDIPLEKCNELANYYQVTMDYLLGLSDDNKEISNKAIDWDKLTVRLYEERKKRNLSQEHLGDKVGLNQMTYSQYERGIFKPRTFKLLIIAEYYNISIDYLLGKSDNPDL